MIRESQLRNLIKHIVKGVLTELDMTDSSIVSPSTDASPTSTSATMSPVMQQKIAREKKKQATNKVKMDQQMLKKVDNDIKSLKTTYDTTRRLTRPSLKKQIDAEKKAIALGT